MTEVTNSSRNRRWKQRLASLLDAANVLGQARVARAPLRAVRDARVALHLLTAYERRQLRRKGRG